jgi:uncharacterized protein
MAPARKRLELLELELAVLPQDWNAMSISMLDGFLAGIAVCPDAVMPEEWLPVVWGGTWRDTLPPSEHAAQLSKIISLLIEHNNATGLDLHMGRYMPAFNINPADGQIFWADWIGGFERATQMRPSSWAALVDKDEEAQTAFAGLLTLVDIRHGDVRLPRLDADVLDKRAPELIARWITVLNSQMSNSSFPTGKGTYQ